MTAEQLKAALGPTAPAETRAYGTGTRYKGQLASCRFTDVPRPGARGFHLNRVTFPDAAAAKAWITTEGTAGCAEISSLGELARYCSGQSNGMAVKSVIVQDGAVVQEVRSFVEMAEQDVDLKDALVTLRQQAGWPAS